MTIANTEEMLMEIVEEVGRKNEAVLINFCVIVWDESYSGGEGKFGYHILTFREFVLFWCSPLVCLIEFGCEFWHRTFLL
jgi:hypothetical protein